MSPETLVVDTPSVPLHCLTWGTEGPLVVMVHGFPDTAWTWDLAAPRLAEKGFRVVAPFTRGIAPTPVPDPPAYGNDRLGQDILDLIDALGSKAILVGHDFGASASYSAAGLGPDRLEKLVTVAIPHPATIQPSLTKLWGVRHFITHRFPGAAGRFAKNDFAQIRVLYERWSPGFDWPDSEFEKTRAAYSQPGVTQAAMDYYSHLTLKPTPGLRARIEVPTLIIGGITDGVATEADFEGSKRRFTGSVDVKMLPGGHFLHREHPEPFLEALLDFL